MVLDKTLKHFIIGDVYGKIDAFGIINGKKSFSLTSHKNEISFLKVIESQQLNWLLSYSAMENVFMV